jgi:hypothetical protein
VCVKLVPIAVIKFLRSTFWTLDVVKLKHVHKIIAINVFENIINSVISQQSTDVHGIEEAKTSSKSTLFELNFTKETKKNIFQSAKKQ